MDVTSEKKESYEELKENVLEKIGDKDAVNLKLHFKDMIESDRTISSIKSIGELIAALEERDFINEDNLSIFDDIFCICQQLNLLIENDVIDIQEAIHLYRKEFDCPLSYKCQVCSIEAFQTELVQLTPTAPQLSPFSFNDIHHTKHSEQSQFEFQSNTNEIDAMISFISKYIGADWRPFVSFLGVQEQKIKGIYSKYGKDNKEHAAYEALNEWKECSHWKSDENRKKELIECLRRESVYQLSRIAEDISHDEHWKELQKQNLKMVSDHKSVIR